MTISLLSNYFFNKILGIELKKSLNIKFQAMFFIEVFFGGKNLLLLAYLFTKINKH